MKYIVASYLDYDIQWVDDVYFRIVISLQ